MSEKTRSVHVARLPEEIPPGAITASTVAVVIDTLRFTTCATWALAAGADRIYVESSVGDALRRRDALPCPALLCGERQCRPIEGFDLGNSPAEYTSERIADRTLIFTTTNGTRAVKAVSGAHWIVLASLTNRSAVARHIMARQAGGPTWLVCAGTNGEVAGEDVLVAGAVLDALQCPTNSAGHSAMALWRQVAGPASGGHETTSRSQGSGTVLPSVVEFFRTTRGGKNLLAAGYETDLPLAAQLDCFDVVPVRTANQAAFTQAGHGS